MTTGRHAVTDAPGRPAHVSRGAGRVGDYMGARAMAGSLPTADRSITDRGHDADRFRDASSDEGIQARIPGRKSRGTPMRCARRRYRRRNRIEIVVARLEDRHRVATRSGRCPTVLLFAVASGATVISWL